MRIVPTSPKVSKSWGLSLGLFGAKATSSENSLKGCQVKRVSQNIPARENVMSKASGQRWVVGFFPSCSNIPLFDNRGTSVTVGREPQRTWTICPVIFTDKFFIFFKNTSEWLPFLGTKDRILSNILCQRPVAWKAVVYFQPFWKTKTKPVLGIWKPYWEPQADSSHAFSLTPLPLLPVLRTRGRRGKVPHGWNILGKIDSSFAHSQK